MSNRQEHAAQHKHTFEMTTLHELGLCMNFNKIRLALRSCNEVLNLLCCFPENVYAIDSQNFVLGEDLWQIAACQMTRHQRWQGFMECLCMSWRTFLLKSAGDPGLTSMTATRSWRSIPNLIPIAARVGPMRV